MCTEVVGSCDPTTEPNCHTSKVDCMTSPLFNTSLGCQTIDTCRKEGDPANLWKCNETPYSCTGPLGGTGYTRNCVRCKVLNTLEGCIYGTKGLCQKACKDEVCPGEGEEGGELGPETAGRSTPCREKRACMEISRTPCTGISGGYQVRRQCKKCSSKRVEVVGGSPLGPKWTCVWNEPEGTIFTTCNDGCRSGVAYMEDCEGEECPPEEFRYHCKETGRRLCSEKEGEDKPEARYEIKRECVTCKCGQKTPSSKQSCYIADQLGRYTIPADCEYDTPTSCKNACKIIRC